MKLHKCAPAGRARAWVFAAVAVCALALAPQASSAGAEELMISSGELGRPGGRVVLALRAEPKTLNPVTAIDNPSKEVIWRTMADLVHINRLSQKTESALARSWKVSANRLRYTLKLRRGVRFSDDHPLEADDVVFSFQV